MSSQEAMSSSLRIELTRLPSHLAGVIAQRERLASKFPGVLMYLHDDGEISVAPFSYRLPYEYASTADEVIQMACPQHFEWAKPVWIYRFIVPEFTALYRTLFEGIEDTGFDEGFARYHAFRLQSLREATAPSPTDVTIVAHTESEVVYEISCEAIAGPSLASSFPPSTGIQAFSRFYAYTRSGLGRYGPLRIEDGRFVSASLVGQDVTDDAAALILEVPEIASLCPDLRRLTLNATALSDQCIERLRTTFPDATIECM